MSMFAEFDNLWYTIYIHFVWIQYWVYWL